MLSDLLLLDFSWGKKAARQENGQKLYIWTWQMLWYSNCKCPSTSFYSNHTSNHEFWTVGDNLWTVKILGDYENWTLEPRTRGPKDPVSWGLCCTVAVKMQLIHAICANAMSLTHGYVLYMVVMLTEGIFIANNTVSLTDPQSSLLSVLQT